MSDYSQIYEIPITPEMDQIPEYSYLLSVPRIPVVAAVNLERQR